ncbi:MAG: DUF1080 domain-containing protein, partial [Candidatus Hydrogenedentes bacterium]|nr:DUF1080 domain-containing protein [Candidatus Hydrogenedentota bacterium]
VAPELSGNCHVYDPYGDEATIHEGRVNWFGRDPDWRDEKGFRGKNDVEKPIGEWNRLECLAEGARITVKLNGVIVNEAVRAEPQAGRIQVQSEGAEIFFRRIELLPLEGKPKP